MSETYYCRVMTKYGNEVHLVEVPSRNRHVKVEGLLTLCNQVAYLNMDGCSDKMSCSYCGRREAKKPRRRRS